MTQAPERIDRRKVRTRALLRDALLELIQEKRYEDISIQDITDRANLNRATFYLHYADKEELLITSLQEIYDALIGSMLPLDPAILIVDNHEFECAILQHVKDNAGFYRVLLSEQSPPAFIVKMTEYVAKVTLDMCKPLFEGKPEPPIPLDASAHYYAGATIGLITWWVKHDFHLPVDTMARMWRELDNNSQMWIVGLMEGN